ncbi:hypothetical protein [Variovorax sp. 350MFTsu5.1]|uniref:hypothetical protein n=1 Tax=Variovorax sp. 350MFTsu5.1 TaxID=3158365 RepID=UPI003AAABC17
MKDETVTIRTTADIKQLLKLAAAREHRSLASTVEMLVRAYAQEHQLVARPNGLGATGDQAQGAGSDR